MRAFSSSLSSPENVRISLCENPGIRLTVWFGANQFSMSGSQWPQIIKRNYVIWNSVHRFGYIKPVVFIKVLRWFYFCWNSGLGISSQTKLSFIKFTHTLISLTFHYPFHYVYNNLPFWFLNVAMDFINDLPFALPKMNFLLFSFSRFHN